MFTFSLILHNVFRIGHLEFGRDEEFEKVFAGEVIIAVRCVVSFELDHTIEEPQEERSCEDLRSDAFISQFSQERSIS